MPNKSPILDDEASLNPLVERNRMLTILTLFTFFTAALFIYSGSMAILGRLFGVPVEEFCIWFNPWFSLIKTKVGKTTFILGWLPWGSYVKFAGMIEADDREPQPNDFLQIPSARQTLIVLSGPIILLLLGLPFVSPNEARNPQLWLSLLMPLLLVLSPPAVVAQALARFNRQFKSKLAVLLMLLALSFCWLGQVYFLAIRLDEHIPFIQNLVGVFQGRFNYSDLLGNLSDAQFSRAKMLLLMLLTLGNLLPFGGLLGGTIVSIWLRLVGAQKAVLKVLEGSQIVGITVLLVVLIYVQYLLIF